MAVRYHVSRLHVIAVARVEVVETTGEEDVLLHLHLADMMLVR